MRDLEDKALLVLVVAVSLLFAWTLWPFSGAILWAVVFAVLFAPVNRRLLRAMPRWPNLAALLTLFIIVVMVLVPLAILTSLVVQEAGELVTALQSGNINLTQGLQQARDALPDWATSLLDRLRAPNLATVRERLTSFLVESGRFVAGQALSFGQMTLHFLIGLFVMLYLVYFLLRDGRALRRMSSEAIPLRGDQQTALAEKFTITIRAIVKGSVVVALVQGALGGLIFALLDIRAPVLWGALMAILALLPVVGTGLVWVPVAIYLMVTGALWQGVALIVYGILVIGLVDNLLRPILVGKDTQIPDYVVLISTLGGISAFGVNGFVIGPVLAAMFLSAWDVFSAWRRGQAPPHRG